MRPFKLYHSYNCCQSATPHRHENSLLGYHLLHLRSFHFLVYFVLEKNFSISIFPSYLGDVYTACHMQLQANNIGDSTFIIFLKVYLSCISPQSFAMLSFVFLFNLDRSSVVYPQSMLQVTTIRRQCLTTRFLIIQSTMSCLSVCA